MKKGGMFFLVGLTLVFAGFIIGMLFGRYITPGPVIIQSVQETKAPTVSADADEPTGTGDNVYKININTANVALLDTLPGIGPVIAQRIIDFREENGPFTSIAQLGQIEGIGTERLVTIYDLITVED